MDLRKGEKEKRKKAKNNCPSPKNFGGGVWGERG